MPGAVGGATLAAAWGPGAPASRGMKLKNVPGGKENRWRRLKQAAVGPWAHFRCGCVSKPQHRRRNSQHTRHKRFRGTGTLVSVGGTVKRTRLNSRWQPMQGLSGSGTVCLAEELAAAAADTSATPVPARDAASDEEVGAAVDEVVRVVVVVVVVVVVGADGFTDCAEGGAAAVVSACGSQEPGRGADEG